MLQDLENIISMLENNLPAEFVEALSGPMMLALSSRIRELWFDQAIPPSLDSMGLYQESLTHIHEIAEKIKARQWPGTDILYDWCNNAPRNWLKKRKEFELDQTRNMVSVHNKCRLSNDDQATTLRGYVYDC